MNVVAVADTHTALWYLFDDPRLGPTAAAFIQNAAATRQKIAISTVSLAEVVYLIEKHRILLSVYDDLMLALSDPEHVFTEAVFTSAIVHTMRDVPRTQIPDLPDRIITATALYFNVPVISRDRHIRSATLMTIW